ncbi:fumarylacetoacetate hydrolase family protein [Halotalea alkalilenta]|uniref:fumarylacetoacetate hydrolase family protein n=1 Tax=Halotalea alkalilenta TaxID=376489 RepID=UPI000489A425|nr:fumarylacetoacetate hydrolase family protein [Halotalea alkalilenta]
MARDAYLPIDLDSALLVGRVWRDAPINGPAVVTIRNREVVDLTLQVATVADLLERSDRHRIVRHAPGEVIGTLDALLDNSLAGGGRAPYLLAPCDLQPVKASGVTFAVSLLERVIEEQAEGDPSRAEAIRGAMVELIGRDLSTVRPGSAEAQALKAEFQRRGHWSPYLEVGIGPDAEVFSKAPPMASIGFGSPVGLHPDSSWNNPEPEIVLAVDSRGEAVGAALGNDVNLRDIEGRSALLLTKAKDNNGSCAIGPFIRLFDERFDIDAVRTADVSLRIEGQDGFELEAISHMSEISRDPLAIVRQTIGAHHQYPDGMMLFLGTMFSPTEDRDTAGGGFTHHLGDRVIISSPRLGALVNEVSLSTEIAPWTYGIRSLFAHLAERRGA